MFTRTALKKVSSTNFSLPAFGFGAAHLGELCARLDEAESRATMDAAWEAELTTFDAKNIDDFSF